MNKYTFMNKKTKIISIVLAILIILTSIFAYLKFNNVWILDEEPKKTEEEIPIVDIVMAEWEVLDIGIDEKTGISYQKQYNSDLGVTVKIPTTWNISDQTEKSISGTFLTIFAPLGFDVKDGTELLEEFASVEFIKYKRSKPEKYFVESLLTDTSYKKIEYKNFTNVLFKSFVNILSIKDQYYIFINNIDLFQIDSNVVFLNNKQKFDKYKAETDFILDSLEFDKK